MIAGDAVFVNVMGSKKPRHSIVTGQEFKYG